MANASAADASASSGSSGSIDVAMSEPRMPAAASGSLDVRFSDPELPAAGAAEPQVAPARRERRRTIPQVAAQLGDVVVHTGDKVIDKVVRAGELAGESLAQLPVASALMPRTRRGRVMAKSVIVSFLLVFSWIAVIVGLQLRRPRPPDFRPLAEDVLIAIRDGKAEQVYRDASTRFQEVVLEDTFVADTDDLNRTLGKYKEITAVLEVEVGRGPSGKFGRLDFRADYGNGPVRGSLSFRWEEGTWKLLGFSVGLPPDAIAEAGTQQMRKARSKGPEAELKAAAEALLRLSATQDYDAMWRQAALGFRQSITLDNFRQTEIDRRKILGPFDRILSVTSATQNPGRTGASLELLIQFEKATAPGSFNFAKIDDEWKLTRYKIVVPLPRVPE